MVKNLPAMQETWVLSLDWEDLLEEEIKTHFSILAWRIPWTEEPGGLSPWGHKESDTTGTTDTYIWLINGDHGRNPHNIVVVA